MKSWLYLPLVDFEATLIVQLHVCSDHQFQMICDRQCFFRHFWLSPSISHVIHNWHWLFFSHIYPLHQSTNLTFLTFSLLFVLILEAPGTKSITMPLESSNAACIWRTLSSHLIFQVLLWDFSKLYSFFCYFFLFFVFLLRFPKLYSWIRQRWLGKEGKKDNSHMEESMCPGLAWDQNTSARKKEGEKTRYLQICSWNDISILNKWIFQK